jgi:hypothetical protein
MQLEKQVNDVEQFYQSTDVQQNDCKYKGREKPPTGSKKALQRASEDMQEEIRRSFNKIFNEASPSTSAITIIVIIVVIIIIISDVYNCWIKIDSCVSTYVSSFYFNS